MSVQIRKPLKPTDPTGLQARRSVKEFMKSVLQDRTLLLVIVAGGKAEWMNSARRAWRGFHRFVDDDTFGALWDQMEQEAGPDPAAQLDRLLKAGLITLKLDKIKNLVDMIAQQLDGDAFQCEAKTDEMLTRLVGDHDERTAVRHQMKIQFFVRHQIAFRF